VLQLTVVVDMFVAVEENDLFDFRGLRMDWYRLQVCKYTPCPEMNQKRKCTKSRLVQSQAAR